MSIGRNTRVPAAVLGVSVAAVALSGCGTLRQAVAPGKVTPDEYRVVAKAPLVVPPEFSLRPPAPGQPRPQELAPESQARAIVLGQRQAIARDEGEKLLVAKAGAERADPLVRYVVDDEFGDLAHKDKSWADRIMFWRKGESPANPQLTQANAAASTPAALDPAAVDAKVKALTGDKPVVIARAPAKRRIKLPGL
jgi:hypothetical protein